MADTIKLRTWSDIQCSTILWRRIHRRCLGCYGAKDLPMISRNWGNILTGDKAAATRYIEARLSKFALAVAFNSKTTNWAASCDGRNQEPVNLPFKFPLLLAHGAGA